MSRILVCPSANSCKNARINGRDCKHSIPHELIFGCNVDVCDSYDAVDKDNDTYPSGECKEVNALKNK